MTALADHAPVDFLATREEVAPAGPLSRRYLWALLAIRVEAFGAPTGPRAAWQGPRGAAEQWRHATGPSDLDIWCDDAAYRELDVLLRELGAARVQHADDPARLRHTSFAIETTTGLAVIDLTRGDLRVGPVLMVPASEVRTTIDTNGAPAPRLTGAAAVADLFVRPLLRGRIVDDARLEEARAAWRATRRRERAALINRRGDQLGATVALGIAQSLSGSRPSSALVRRARLGLAVASLRPANLASSWRQRHTIRPARNRAGMLDLSTRGCLVVLVGTDGSGKSTVAGQIDERLRACQIPTTTVYMGMARGNLPGVSTARRLLGIAAAGDSAPTPPASSTSVSPLNPPRRRATDKPTDHVLMRRLAAWFYAVEYGYRWWRDIRPAMKDGLVVIADRYVYDLRESPWPDSAASRVAERFMPRPDVLVLPDAPDALIHARKPERPAHEQAAQQGRFRMLIASDPAWTASLRVDTSGSATEDGVAPVVRAVVESMHRDHTGAHHRAR